MRMREVQQDLTCWLEARAQWRWERIGRPRLTSTVHMILVASAVRRWTMEHTDLLNHSIIIWWEIACIRTYDYQASSIYYSVCKICQAGIHTHHKKILTSAPLKFCSSLIWSSWKTKFGIVGKLNSLKIIWCVDASQAKECQNLMWSINAAVFLHAEFLTVKIQALLASASQSPKPPHERFDFCTLRSSCVWLPSPSIAWFSSILETYTYTNHDHFTWQPGRFSCYLSDFVTSSVMCTSLIPIRNGTACMQLRPYVMIRIAEEAMLQWAMHVYIWSGYNFYSRPVNC